MKKPRGIYLPDDVWSAYERLAAKTHSVPMRGTNAGQKPSLNALLFQLFTALQQIVSGFWNRKDEAGNVTRLEFPHERLDTLQEAVERIPEGEKVIVWCKYHYSLNAIVERLAAAYGPDAIAQFHGNLNERQRTHQVERFRHEAKFMVAIQQSG